MMATTSDTPVIFCFDQRQGPHAAVATASLIRSNPYPLQILWIVEASDAPAAARWMAAVPAAQARIDIITVKDGIFADWPTDARGSRASYLRLLIPRAAATRQALYLDCDVLVTGDLRPLLTSELGSVVLAGAPDHAFSGEAGKPPPFPPICSDSYVDAGVLMMNLAQMRSDGLLRRSAEIQRDHAAAIHAQAACILNKYAEGRKLAMGNRWNYQVRPYSMSKRKWDFLMQSGQVAMFHFSGMIKPWQTWCPPWVRREWEALARGMGLEDHVLEADMSIDDALTLAAALDRDGEHRLCSTIRETLIAVLLDRTGDSAAQNRLLMAPL